MGESRSLYQLSPPLFTNYFLKILKLNHKNMPNSLDNQVNNLRQALISNAGKFASVIPEGFLKVPPLVFDFTAANKELNAIDLNDINAFSNYIKNKLDSAGAKVGVGGYGEDRVLYKNSKLFNNGVDEPRSVHLAVDLWMPAYTSVSLPLNGKIHSFQNNNNFLDYGPTIIFEHQLNNIIFYTLFGHLSKKSLQNLKVGQEFSAGQTIAQIGDSTENGQWSPHLHFQIISDMKGKTGDFPGVAKPSEKEYYLTLCPNPNLILNIPELPQ